MSKLNSIPRRSLKSATKPSTEESLKLLHSTIKFFVKKIDGSYDLQSKAISDLEKLLQRQTA